MPHVRSTLQPMSPPDSIELWKFRVVHSSSASAYTSGEASEPSTANRGGTFVIESFSRISPPDDSGTDAMTRFRYQAHVTFRFCLACYFEQGVIAVTPEHFEDVLVEATNELRFVQIKTRNPDRGPWKFRHLMDDGGALRSLLRTHRALAGSATVGRSCTTFGWRERWTAPIPSVGWFGRTTSPTSPCLRRAPHVWAATRMRRARCWAA